MIFKVYTDDGAEFKIDADSYDGKEDLRVIRFCYCGRMIAIFNLDHVIAIEEE